MQLAGFISKHRTLLAVIVLSLIFTACYYGPVLLHPSEFLLNDKGDAIKNYYVYQWHIEHDASFVNYTGTNYPYGEHQGYTDGNPLLSNLLKLLPFSSDYSIAIYNLSMILSFTVCASVLLKIFEELEVRGLFAVIAAVGISILCPQVFRLTGHFALSYSFFIPLTIWLLLVYEKRERKMFYTILICIALLCSLFVHPYLGMINAALASMYWGFKLVVEISRFRKQILPFIIQGVIPVAAYLLYMKIMDTHTDRPEKPYGFLYYTASFETVFISTHPPFRHMLSQVYKIKSQNWEGVAYVGVTSLVCFLGLPFLLYRNRHNVKSYFRRHIFARPLLLMMAASAVMLFFSMGYPFKWNMEWLLKHFSLVEQFRAPGRFAWAFYFVTTVCCTLVISRYFIRNVNKNIRIVVCSSLLLLYTVEGIPYHRDISQYLFVKNSFNINSLDPELQKIVSIVKQRNVQAIIPLPFFHMGTDHFNIPGSENIIRPAFFLSYHTALPLMANLTPRTSLTESVKLIGIVGDDLQEKKIRDDIPSMRPFVILCSKEALHAEEERLLARSHQIMETEHFIVKEISVGELLDNNKEDRVTFYMKHKNDLVKSNGCLITAGSYFKIIHSEPLVGGSFIIPAGSLEKDSIYEVSLWYHAELNDDINTVLTVSAVGDSANIIAERNVNTMTTIDKGKIKVVLDFKAVDPSLRYTIGFKEEHDRKLIVDDLLIRRKHVDIYKMEYINGEKDSALYVNNFLLQLPLRKN